MDKGSERMFQFDGFSLDPQKRLLCDAEGNAVSLTPKAFDILVYLIERAGEVVEKEAILSAVWGDTIVEENNLTQNVSSLRRALGERHRENRYIATVPGRGYKFVANVVANPVLTNPTERPQVADEPASRTRSFLLIAAAITLLILAAASFYFFYSHDTKAGHEIKSIAVLPFRSITPQGRDEVLEHGMAEALIMKLGAMGEIIVRPKSSLRDLNLEEKDISAAGRLLNVEAILEGSIQNAGDRVRVSANLWRVSDGRQIWSGQFDERSADIFALQDSISDRVASALRISPLVRKKSTNPVNVDAYQAYMRGNFHASRLILPEVLKGIEFYEQAIAIDPNYALAYVGLANAYRALVLTNDADPSVMMPKAKDAAQKAVEADNTLAEAHTALAITSFWYDYDWKSSERHYLTALDLNKNSPQARLFYAHLLSNLGRHEEALAQLKLARELDPISLVAQALEGQALFFAGRHDDAVEILETTVAMEPNFWLAHLFIARIHLDREDYEGAIRSAATASKITNGNAEAMATIGFAHAKSGRIDEARGVIDELQNRKGTRYVPLYAIAQIHVALGENDAAIELLEAALQHKAPGMTFLKVDPKWKGLNYDPRFKELLQRMNF